MNRPEWMGELRSAWNGVFGLPDYEAYLRHAADRHPERPPMSREEFSRAFIDNRYGGMRSRCC
jgi:uncharacterized short protein YbdD (DUF466 family)